MSGSQAGVADRANSGIQRERVGLGGLVAGGCGGSTAASGGTTTPVKASGGGSNASSGKKEPPPVEAEVIVKVRANMFPPVDVGAWVCEPKSWNDKGEAHLKCTAPPARRILIPALKEMPEVVSAEPVS